MTEAPSVSAETELKGLRLPARTDDEFTAVHTGEANTPHLPSSMSTQPLQPEVHARAPFAVGRGRFPALRCRPVVGRFLPGGCFRHQLLLPSHYLVLTKPLRLDIQCQRCASIKIVWKYLDNQGLSSLHQHLMTEAPLAFGSRRLGRPGARSTRGSWGARPLLPPTARTG